MDCNIPGFPVLHYLLEFAQTHVHWISDTNHLILCLPLLILPSIFSSIRVFSSESVLHIRWLKYWSFSISPSSEYSGLISFRIDWFDLLAVQGTLKSLLQHHNLKATILWCSASLMVQVSHLSVHDYWKNHSSDYMELCWQSNTHTHTHTHADTPYWFSFSGELWIINCGTLHAVLFLGCITRSQGLQRWWNCMMDGFWVPRSPLKPKCPVLCDLHSPFYRLEINILLLSHWEKNKVVFL